MPALLQSFPTLQLLNLQKAQTIPLALRCRGEILQKNTLADFLFLTEHWIYYSSGDAEDQSRIEQNFLRQLRYLTAASYANLQSDYQNGKNELKNHQRG